MELKIYIRMLLKRWRIVVPAFVITLLATVVFTFTQSPVYKASTTFIVAPASSVNMAGTVTVIDTASRQPQIASTYAEAAISRKIRREAIEALNLSAAQAEKLVVRSKLRSGTNVFEITVEGDDPVLVSDFANKIGDKTVAYVQKLYEVYGLTPLDSAVPPAGPTRPNKKLNLVLGAALGLALGLGLAFLAEYLQAPLQSMMNFNILDAETGVYNSRYFTQRLGEEMSRAKRNKYPLSLALMDADSTDEMSTALSPDLRGEAMRRIAVLLRHSMREEDIVARLDGHVFGFLLPDMPTDKVEAVMQDLQTKVALSPLEMEGGGVKLNVSSAASVATYRYNGMTQSNFLDEARQALQRAAAAGNGKVHQPDANGNHAGHEG